MDQIINELSANGGYQDKYAADIGMQQLLTLSKAIIAIGFNSTIRTTRDCINRNLSIGYTVYAWATERTANSTQREFQRYFLTLATKCPYIEDFLDEEEKDHLVEYQHKSEIALGIGLADLWGVPVLSLGSDAQFQVDYISVSKTIISENSENKIDIQVLNLWKIEQIENIRNELEKSAWQTVKNGKDLLAELHRLLPMLRLCESACNQIKGLSGSEQFFPEVIKHLFILNKTMADYTGGAFNPRGINWSADTTSTLQRFSDCRTFVCLDGEIRTFTYHSKILSANKRIYFFPLPSERIVHIGYVGDHLPTVRHRT